MYWNLKNFNEKVFKLPYEKKITSFSTYATKIFLMDEILSSLKSHEMVFLDIAASMGKRGAQRTGRNTGAIPQNLIYLYPPNQQARKFLWQKEMGAPV